MEARERPPAGPRGRIGATAEAAAAELLAAAGWTVLGRNLRLGGDEIDLLARSPDRDRTLVIVEVRARTGQAFGSGLESVDARKVARLYRAAATLRRCGHHLLGPGPVAGLLRVDLVVLRTAPAGGWVVERHLRGLEPPGRARG